MRKQVIPALILTIFLSIAHSLSAQQTLGLFTKATGSKDGYVLFSPNSYAAHYLIDKCGKLVHKWNTKTYPGWDAFILPNGNLLSTGIKSNPYFPAPSAGGLLEIYNWDNKLLWSYTISDSLEIQNHDVYPLANGHILVAIWDRHSAAEAALMGRDTTGTDSANIWSAKIEEIEPIGTDSAKIIWQWRLWDHLIQDFDSTKLNYGVVADHPELLNINFNGAGPLINASDWTHLNSVTYNADLDQIMISIRNMNEIYIIDHSTSSADAATHKGGAHGKGGDFLYRWGCPSAYNRGSQYDQRLFVQHDATWIPKGYRDENKIMVFNNGTGRLSGDYSSVEVINPPIDSSGNYTISAGKAFGPANSYWSYQAPNPFDFYSTVEGGAQRLSNGNTLICEATKGHFFEIDSNNNVVWDYVNPVSSTGPLPQQFKAVINAVYRANLYELTFPGFKNHRLSPGKPIELFPFSYSCYMPTLLDISPLYAIFQLKGIDEYTGIADSVGAGQGFIKGVVHSKSFDGGSLQFSLIDSTGAITIYAGNIKYYTPSIGDSILVKGHEIQTNGVIQYQADSIINLVNGHWLETPNVVTKLDESTESNLVKINNVHIIDTTSWYGNGNPFDVNITNGKDTFVMRINTTVDLYKMRQLNEKFNVTGIASQEVSSLPYLGGYFIQPRGVFDIQHVDQLYKIKQVRIQNNITGIADSAGSKNRFYVKGVVQSQNFTTIGADFSIKDNTGSIFITSSSISGIGYTPIVSDSIEVRGFLTQINGLTAIEVDSVFTLTRHSQSLTPKVVTLINEGTEATLVKFNNAWLIEPNQWSTAGTGFSADITDGKDTMQLYIANVTDLFFLPAPRGKFNVTGICTQNKQNAPFFGNYQLMPRGAYDVQLLPNKLYTINKIKPIDKTTGNADSINSYCILKGIVECVNLVENPNQFYSLQDSTGSILVSSDEIVFSYTPNPGDSIAVSGFVKQDDGLIHFYNDSVNVIQHGVIKPPVFVQKLDETTESELITLQDYQLANTPKWDTTGANGKMFVKAYKALDTISIEILKGTDLYNNNVKPSGHFDITGIGAQNDPAAPYFKDYLIIPRSIADIQHSSGILEDNDLSKTISLYPNPASNNLYISANFEIGRVDIINTIGEVINVQNSKSNTMIVDISRLTAGIYFLKIENSNSRYYKKFVKE